MLALGIEGTAHTLGIGIVSEERILADIRKVYKPKEGIHPREAARFLAENMKEAITEALNEANISYDEIDVISFSKGPGLGPCLRTVATAARVLAMKYDKPIIGVNHCIAHIEIGNWLSKAKDPLVVYCSGANTQILKLRESRYRIFGETLDVGIGNMLDKFGRELGLEHPQGPKIEELAREGKNYIRLPYTVKGTDLSFSGLLTSAIQKYKSKRFAIEDICFSLQETAFAMITEVTERALAHLNAKEVLLTGGVGNNKRLQEMLKLMVSEHGAKFYIPEGYCSDNGVMIAVLGLLMFKHGYEDDIDATKVDPNFRPDSVDVFWR